MESINVCFCLHQSNYTPVSNPLSFAFFLLHLYLYPSVCSKSYLCFLCLQLVSSVLSVSSLTGSEQRGNLWRRGTRQRVGGDAYQCMCVCLCVGSVQCCVLPLPWRHLLSHTHITFVSPSEEHACVAQFTNISVRV